MASHTIALWSRLIPSLANRSIRLSYGCGVSSLYHGSYLLNHPRNCPVCGVPLLPTVPVGVPGVPVNTGALLLPDTLAATLPPGVYVSGPINTVSPPAAAVMAAVGKVKGVPVNDAVTLPVHVGALTVPAGVNGLIVSVGATGATIAALAVAPNSMYDGLAV